MSTALRDTGCRIDDPAHLGRTLDDLLATRAEPPAVFALGEPTHGIVAFPLLRNEVLAHLVERGYRSIVLETDHFAASIVDDYVAGGAGDLDAVLAKGFSHGFGNVPGNRELVEWLREHNAGREPANQVRFHGFDAPTETAFAPSPRHALTTAIACLPEALRPDSARDVDALLGDDAPWVNEAVMYEPAASIGDSENARALRIVADDVLSAVHRAAPVLGEEYDRAAAHARTALGLSRYHAAMARSAPDRISVLLSLRAEMMADNLLAILDAERTRGPVLVFAHNMHVIRAHSRMRFGPEEAVWASAGALVGRTLGDRYLVVASDANPASVPGTFQHALAEATDRRTLFPATALPALKPGEPILPGHLPLDPADLDRTDAVVFIADTDGKRVQYW